MIEMLVTMLNTYETSKLGEMFKARFAALYGQGDLNNALMLMLSENDNERDCITGMLVEEKRVCGSCGQVVGGYTEELGHVYAVLKEWVRDRCFCGGDWVTEI